MKPNFEAMTRQELKSYVLTHRDDREAIVREFLDYRALMQAYIGQGLRADLEQLEGRLQMANLVASLKW